MAGGLAAAEAEAGQQLMTPQLVQQQRISDVVKGPISEDDIVRVSARLAAAGWPLAAPLSGSGERGSR